MNDLRAYHPKEAAALTCGECATFAHGWMGRDWNCRRADRQVNADTSACEKWTERQPDPEPDWEAMRRYGAMLDEVLGPALRKEPEVVAPRRKERVAPPGLRGREGGVVYFIDSGEFTKIGFTGYWIENRMKGLMATNPHELRLWGLIPGDRSVEFSIHEALAAHKHRYEWFRLPPELRETIKASIIKDGGEVYE